MWPFKKKLQRKVWSELQISLYERQIAAREALGDQYICHPSNDSRRKTTFKTIPLLDALKASDGNIGYYEGYDILRLEAAESVLQTAEYTWKEGPCELEDHTVTPPRLWIVK